MKNVNLLCQFTERVIGGIFLPCQFGISIPTGEALGMVYEPREFCYTFYIFIYMFPQDNRIDMSRLSNINLSDEKKDNNYPNIPFKLLKFIVVFIL